ncbi:MAG: hypothetical protein P4N24_11195 [Acidobacteriota bacterium]|nr:hypothetical protein [Acidobacteriota bacterium]
MRKISFVLVLVFLAASAVIAQAQEPGSASQLSVPAAVRSQAECTGFIVNPPVPRDLFVVGGADDDFHSPARQFVQGESIFISQHKGGDIAVGSEYNVVRPAGELFLTRRYQGQGREVGKLGKPYEDVGIVKVTHTNKEGAVARVTLSCGPISPGDILVPYQARAIPEYTLSPPLDHFAPLDSNKKQGRITASHNNYGFLGRETVVYLNVGENEGAKPGQRYRIYKVLPPHTTGFLTEERTPPETIGEAVVLSVKSKSCVAMVISSYREISTGDFVEAE